MIKLCAFADEASSDLMGQIDALKRNDICFLELRSINGKNVKDLSTEEAKKYSAVLKENGIEVFSIGSPLGKVDINVNFDDYLKEVVHVFELAKIFGAKKVRAFSFYNAYNEREKVIKYLTIMADMAQEHGLDLCHENEKEIYGDVANRVLDILENVPKLKSVYDPANFLQVGETADTTLDLLHSRADYFHIKDMICKTEEIVPAGYGDGNIAELVKRIDGDKVLSIEPHLAIFGGYNQIDGREMKHKFHFSSNDEAFDTAVSALKGLLTSLGYKEKEGGFIK